MRKQPDPCETARVFSPKIFRSRWSALFWAAGILWTAYDVAGSTPPPAKAKPAAPTDALGDPVDANALAVLANAAP